MTPFKWILLWKGRLSTNHPSIQNRMFFAWFMSWVESIPGVIASDWVELIQFLGKLPELWGESIQNFHKVSWFDWNGVKSHPSLAASYVLHHGPRVLRKQRITTISATAKVVPFLSCRDKTEIWPKAWNMRPWVCKLWNIDFNEMFWCRN